MGPFRREVWLLRELSGSILSSPLARALVLVLPDAHLNSGRGVMP